MSSPLNNRSSVEAALEGASSMTEVLEGLGLRPAGANFAALRVKCEAYGLEVPVYDPTKVLRRNAVAQTIPLEEVLVENSTYSNGQKLKQRLIEAGFLEDRCYGELCSVSSSWLGKPIVLQLEHINGVGNDNRIENLTILCPNCHSQTPTFCGRNRPRPGPGAVPKNKCSTCQKSISKRALMCLSCRGLTRTTIKWPDIEVLKVQVESEGFEAVGRSLGVSGNAVRKHIKNRS